MANNPNSRWRGVDEDFIPVWLEIVNGVAVPVRNRIDRGVAYDTQISMLSFVVGGPERLKATTGAQIKFPI